jgi:predicted transcriptional regulator
MEIAKELDLTTSGVHESATGLVANGNIYTTVGDEISASWDIRI